MKIDEMLSRVIFIFAVAFSIILLIGGIAQAASFSPDRENYLSYSQYNDVEEVKFQISIMSDIYDIYGKLKLSGSYTQRSYWRLFDDKDSRYFRPSDYNPQIYFNYSVDSCIYKLGYWHESNGERNNYDKDGNLSKDSRSWDRKYVELECEEDKFFTRVSYWNVYASENPGIEEKMGNIQGYFRYKLGAFELSTELSKGHKEFNIKLPTLFSKSINIVLSARKGYGDSLTDWDQDILRYSLKLSFAGE